MVAYGSYNDNLNPNLFCFEHTYRLEEFEGCR